LRLKEWDDGQYDKQLNTAFNCRMPVKKEKQPLGLFFIGIELFPDGFLRIQIVVGTDIGHWTQNVFASQTYSKTEFKKILFSRNNTHIKEDDFDQYLL
jgi:hypothetical protein